MSVDPPLAAAAATRRSPADLERLQLAYHSVRAEPEAAPTVQHVAEFFRALGEASGNPALVLAHEPLIQLLEPSLAAMIDKVAQARTRIIDAQRRLCAAVETRDPASAQTWMSKHIRDFRRGYELAGINLRHTVAHAGPLSRGGG